MLPIDDTTSRFGLHLRRWGPTALIAAMLLVVAALVVTRGGEGGPAASTAAVSSWTDIGDTPPGAPAPTGRMPVTYDEAQQDGEVDDHRWPDTCDMDRGTVELPSVYALPCVPTPTGDNGGATTQGVTATTIKVVYYAPEQGADLASLLGAAGVDDTAEQRTETLEQYIELYSSVAELYGRRIELVPFAATGATNDVVAARADATDIIAMEPFAVIGGPQLDQGTFVSALAEAGILCMGCTTALPDDMVEALAPYAWSATPSIGQTLDLLDGWAGALDVGAGQAATYAGDDLRDQPRKLGVIHLEQDPPVFDATVAEHAGIADIALRESYLLDVAGMPAKAAELIARFKAEGITTIAFLGDPLMPIYLTQAATAQDYFPEWIYTGSVLTDTNAFGRQYDAAQMSHSFGISALAATTDQDVQESIRLYRWYHDDPEAMPPARNQYGLVAPSAAWLVAGIHMAGPDLSVETFARGMFRIPPAGGGPTTPRVSYGNWGAFTTMDYNGVDDAAEIWWDPDVEAPDERGELGRGAWRRSHGGARFTAADSPQPDLFAHPGDTVTVVDRLAAAEQPPDYPPPAR